MEARSQQVKTWTCPSRDELPTGLQSLSTEKKNVKHLNFYIDCLLKYYF